MFFVLVAAIFALGGFVKGVVGLGLPTIAMGLLSVLMLPAQAAALLVVPSLVTNLWQIGGPGMLALLRRLAPMLLGVCAGAWLGAGWLTDTGSSLATLGLGLSLIAYAALGLLKWRMHVMPSHETRLAPLIGLATGLVTAATGVFVIPAVPYLQALGMEKETLVRALGISFLVSTIALGVALGSSGALQATALAGSALALLPALAGMGAGQWLRLRVQPETFKTIFFCGLLALGAYLALRAALHLN
ncbi:MAG: sulfite exporter TauE/SafE family protein [Rhizobiales bacterium]|nr:sulfite exporter TauE/SafE family protein [Rhizobacter sp.]